MIYATSPVTDPGFNLAMEQYLFEERRRDEPWFLLWQNENSIIVGRNQNTAAELDEAYTKENGIRVVRRTTGGGAVYHDLGNLNFTFISKAANAGELDFHLFCEPVAAALRKMGVPVEVSGRNDMLIGGKKFSGNSQRIQGGWALHHGTILFDSNLSVLTHALRVSKDKLHEKGVASVRSRVVNVKESLPESVTLQEFWQGLLTEIFHGAPPAPYRFTDRDLGRINEIRKRRYDTWEWNYGQSPQYSTHKEKRFEGCGKLEILLQVTKGRITSCKIYGDYFGSRDSSEIESALLGCTLTDRSLESRLTPFSIGEYFHHLTKLQFIELLVS